MPGSWDALTPHGSDSRADSFPGGLLVEAFQPPAMGRAPGLGAGILTADREKGLPHSPTRADDRERARRRGGRASSKLHRARRLAPPDMVDLYETLEAALRQVHDGDLSPPRAMAMASLARAMVSTKQVGELEEKIRMIERMIADDITAA